MISTLPIDTAQFERMVSNSVSSVFHTMLDLKVDLCGTSSMDCNGVPVDYIPVTARGESLVVGNVGFVGRITGMVYLYMTYHFATRLASRMLGMTEQEVESEDMVNDVIGEISNMVVGQFKNQLDQEGYACRLTIPSILRGSNFVVEPVRSAERQVFYFKCGEDDLAYDILMKPGE